MEQEKEKQNDRQAREERIKPALRIPMDTVTHVITSTMLIRTNKSYTQCHHVMATLVPDPDLKPRLVKWRG
jgi:hypothetical protein